jgi:hypothetical protein
LGAEIDPSDHTRNTILGVGQGEQKAGLFFRGVGLNGHAAINPIGLHEFK